MLLSDSIFVNSVDLGCSPQTFTCRMLKTSVEGVGVGLGVGVGVSVGACAGVCVDDNPVANLFLFINLHETMNICKFSLWAPLCLSKT